MYYRTDSSSDLTEGCEVGTTSCTVSDLADGETYHFVATAYNSYGESEPSDPVSYTVPDVLQTFTITSSAGGNGSISPTGTFSLTEGQSKTFTISPKSGFHIDGVLVDGVFKGTTSTYTFQNLSANHTIAASFAAVPVSAPSDDGSSGSTTGTNPSGSSDTPAPTGVETDNSEDIVSPAVTPAQEFVNQAPDRPGLLFPVDGAQDVSLTPLLEIAGFTDPDADDDHGATRWQIADGRKL